MILQKEVREKSQAWGVPHQTVEKDHALGHFLAAFNMHYGEQLWFKGGTCLRKCYFPEYRFSEDLDFSSLEPTFSLEAEPLGLVCSVAKAHSGIVFIPDDIEPILHNDERKGTSVLIWYWGANHSRHESPPPKERWHTKIKLEISTEEMLLLPPETRAIWHPYSDMLLTSAPVECYALDEVIAEKLRALVQRSYSASRDFYDLYQLTDNFSSDDWDRIRPLFLEKMRHKEIEYAGPEELVAPQSILKVRRDWDRSINHQVRMEPGITADHMIEAVRNRILQYL